MSVSTDDILILNDTAAFGAHFGCAKVMGTLRRLLGETPGQRIPSIPVKADCLASEAHREALRRAKVVVINGEGTMHHGKTGGQRLVDAGCHAKEHGARVHLVNAVWQDNPPEWGRAVAGFDSLACRDSRSAEILSRQSGRDVGWLCDLSLHEPAPAAEAPRRGLLVSDSFSVTTSLALMRHAGRSGAEYVPVTARLPRRLEKRARLNRGLARLLPFLVQAPADPSPVADVDAFLARLAGAEAMITGRFHVSCMAILTRTPFVAIASNTWKIEALLKDFELDPRRCLPASELGKGIAEELRSFSPAELNAIDSRLAEMRGKISAHFAEILGDG